MSEPNVTENVIASRDTAKAIMELERISSDQNIRPFNINEWLSDSNDEQSPEEIRKEVDAFLEMLDEFRKLPSVRSLD